jgi:hypothetical protein
MRASFLLDGVWTVRRVGSSSVAESLKNPAADFLREKNAAGAYRSSWSQIANAYLFLDKDRAIAAAFILRDESLRA